MTGPINRAYSLHKRKQQGAKLSTLDLANPNSSGHELLVANKKERWLPQMKRKYSPRDPISLYEKEQNKLADELVEWVKGVDMEGDEQFSRIEIRDFFDQKNILFWDFKQVAKENPYVAKQLAVACQRISANVRKDWFRFKGQHTAAHSILREMDAIYKEAEKEEASMKKDIKTEEQRIFISSVEKPDTWIEVRDIEEEKVCLKD